MTCYSHTLYTHTTHSHTHSTDPSCTLSRRLIQHWRNCQCSHCPICLPLKQFSHHPYLIPPPLPYAHLQPPLPPTMGGSRFASHRSLFSSVLPRFPMSPVIRLTPAAIRAPASPPHPPPPPPPPLAESELGGYDCKFANDPPNALVCLVCRVVAKDPQQVIHTL